MVHSLVCEILVWIAGDDVEPPHDGSVRLTARLKTIESNIVVMEFNGGTNVNSILTFVKTGLNELSTFIRLTCYYLTVSILLLKNRTTQLASLCPR